MFYDKYKDSNRDKIEIQTKGGEMAGYPGHGFHHTRGDLHPGNRQRSDCIEIDDLAECPEKLAPDFFVPNFTVFRPVLATDEVREFHSRVESYLSKAGDVYKVRGLGRLSLTILEQQALIRTFHEAKLKPYAEDMHDVVENVHSGIKSHVKSKPHSMPFLTGNIRRLGEDDRSIGIVPEGWKGFKARYPRRGADGEFLLNAQVIGEVNIITGAIANTFGDEVNSDGESLDVNLRAIAAWTPHITIAKKVRGGPISSAEINELHGHIASFMPSEIPVFDPLMRVRLDRDNSGVYLNYRDSPEEYETFMTVRNPKVREYGSLLLRYFND